MDIKKIVIVLDSFKGSLSSLAAGQAFADGVKEADNNIETIVYSVADGGEGTIEALHQNCGGTLRVLDVNDPLFRKVRAEYVELGDGTVVIEMAKASGLTLVEPELRNPMNTTTHGTGELIEHALDNGAKKIILAIGGSATNDGGIGMLSALGIRFIDKNTQELSPIGGNLGKINTIDTSSVHPKLKECEFVVACDVDNPLCGTNGAAHIYGPQKGATPEIVETLDQSLRHFAGLISEEFALDISQIKGSGAAGGMGAGLLAFTNTTLKSGIEIILDQIGINTHLSDADLVFVGEGQLDKQTVMGKAPMGIAQRAQQYKIPVIAIGGSIDGDPKELHDYGITAYFAAVGRPMSLEQAMTSEETYNGLKRQGRELIKLMKI